jgi:hypothetical protein
LHGRQSIQFGFAGILTQPFLVILNALDSLNYNLTLLAEMITHSAQVNAKSPENGKRAKTKVELWQHCKPRIIQHCLPLVGALYKNDVSCIS